MKKKRPGRGRANALRQRVIMRDHYTCQCCRRQLHDLCLTIDHIIPVCLGGSTTMRNLQTLCHVCHIAFNRRLHSWWEHYVAGDPVEQFGWKMPTEDRAVLGALLRSGALPAWASRSIRRAIKRGAASPWASGVWQDPNARDLYPGVSPTARN